MKATLKVEDFWLFFRSLMEDLPLNLSYQSETNSRRKR